MARRKMPETLEELSAEREQSEKQLHYWEDKEKIPKHHAEDSDSSDAMTQCDAISDTTPPLCKIASLASQSVTDTDLYVGEVFKAKASPLY